MSKKKTTEVETEVEIEFKAGRATVDRKASIVVVKETTIYVAKTQEYWPHDGATAVHDHNYKLESISLEDGATAILAGLWADHVALGAKSGLASIIGECVLYQSIEHAYREIPAGKFQGIANRTRHGAVLRVWHRLEEDSDRPRLAIVADLVERLRLFGSNAPVAYGSFASLPTLEQPAKAVG